MYNVALATARIARVMCVCVCVFFFPYLRQTLKTIRNKMK